MSPLSGKVRHVVVFDGSCLFCTRTLMLVARMDREEKIFFAPSQSTFGTKLMKEYFPNDSADDTVGFVTDGAGYTYSSAFVRILSMLPFPFFMLAWLLWLIPKPLRDFGYRFIAARRYSIFGQRKDPLACPVPTPSIARRYLGDDRAELLQMVSPTTASSVE